MTQEERIDAFVVLGEKLGEYLKRTNSSSVVCIRKAFEEAYFQNNWFIREFLRESIVGICQMLKREQLVSWISAYPSGNREGGVVACVMAGNIPLVGFHDMLCVLLSGHKFVGKMSHKDTRLLPMLKDLLCGINSYFEKNIVLVDSLKGVEYDAVIATGSNNSARYFEQYFGDKPNIIRKGRSSIAILSGKETTKDLKKLADDVFLYFGLGCRNVSKIYIPKGFDIKQIFPSFEKYAYLQNHHKWMNNYDYNRSIMLVNQTDFYDTGFALFVKNKQLLSPIAVVHYEEYESVEQVLTECEDNKEALQCVVTQVHGKEYISFGKAQFPNIDDYADDIDTMEFLRAL